MAAGHLYDYCNGSIIYSALSEILDVIREKKWNEG